MSYNTNNYNNEKLFGKNSIFPPKIKLSNEEKRAEQMKRRSSNHHVFGKNTIFPEVSPGTIERRRIEKEEKEKKRQEEIEKDMHEVLTAPPSYYERENIVEERRQAQIKNRQRLEALRKSQRIHAPYRREKTYVEMFKENVQEIAHKTPTALYAASILATELGEKGLKRLVNLFQADHQDQHGGKIKSKKTKKSVKKH
jgi:hypothetical protein